MGLLQKKDKRTGYVREAENSTIIGKGTIITGNMESFGNIRIEGVLNGDLRSQSKVVLGDGSSVTGDIFAQNAEIEGEVTGHLYIAEQLILKSTSNVKGNIFALSAETEIGHKHSGHCEIGLTPDMPQKALNGTSKPKELPQKDGQAEGYSKKNGKYVEETV